MTTKHKHYDVIIAFAEGKTIQCEQIHGEWKDCEHPNFSNSLNYRVKPGSDTRYFRVVRTTEDVLLVSDVNKDDTTAVTLGWSRCPNFVEWLSLWIPYKV